MIPSEIDIDGIAWSVSKTDDLPANEFGETRDKEARILLAIDTPEQRQEQTFWHELIHAFFRTRDFRVSRGMKRGKIEEEVASFLGPALHTFFLHNADIQWRADLLE